MSEKQQKIASIKDKMKNLDEDTPLYKNYLSILSELERTSVVKLHVAEEAVCDACQ